MAPRNQNVKPIVPVKDHFPARVTYRGSSVLIKIKKKFEVSGVIEQAKRSPFRQFFEVQDLQFSGALYHSMMLHKSECTKKSEVQFCFGPSYVRFGLTEFALITGLNFSEEPSAAEMEAHCTSDRLLDNHFNGMSEKLVLKQLEDAFENATDADDIFKLGLCCLVEGVLIAHEPMSKITVSYLRMVEDLEFFYKYPWGKVSFEKMMSSLRKDMLHQLSLFQNKKQKEDKAKHVAQYTVYGYDPALQYWTYEAISEIKIKYGVRIPGILTPMMLQWRSKEEPTYQSIADILNRRSKLTVYPFLCPRPIEKQYHDSITHTELPLHLRVGDEEIIDDEPAEGEGVEAQSRRLEELAVQSNLFQSETEHEESRSAHHHSPDTAPQPRELPSSSAAGDFITPDHPVFQNLLATVSRMDADQQKIMVDQQTILSDRHTLQANQAAMIDKLAQLDQQNIVSKQQKIVADQQSILANQQSIIEKLGQLQSHVDILIAQRQGIEPEHESSSSDGDEDDGATDGDGGAIKDGGASDPTEAVGEAVVRNKRTRNPPPSHADFTDPTKRRKLNPKPKRKRVQGYKRFDLDGRPDKKYSRFFVYWVMGERPGIANVHCGTTVHGTKWFRDLKTLTAWLDDSHMDAAFHLLRRRRHYLTDLFRQDIVVLSSLFQTTFDCLNVGRRGGKIDLGGFKQFLNGDPVQFLAPWYPGVNEIYFCLLVNKHWVAVQASLVEYKLTIYDCDIGANSDSAMQKVILPICKYFPKILAMSQEFTKRKLPDAFTWHRCNKGEVPQQVNSGDCGMFAIKHIEHLMIGRPIKSITSDKMQTYQNEWCLDIFYQAIRMPVYND